MVFLDFIKSIVFGIVEGITEWLPVSSTGHMIILEKIMPLSASPEFMEMFLVVIQLGAIIAVILTYWNKLWPLGRKKRTGELAIKKRTLNLWVKIIISCIPAIIVGVFLDDFFEKLFYNYVSVAIALIVFGVAFIYVENRNHGVRPVVCSIEEMDYLTALKIGLFQVIAAIFPGTSRSGATILGSLLIGVNRKTAAEYTFFLAVPAMIGASLLKLVKFGFHFTFGSFVVLILGMAVAFLVSMIVIRVFMSFIKKHDFKVFGWYRIALGIVIIIFAIATH